MGTYRNQGTMEAFHNIYNKAGYKGFWAGWQPKMLESFLKGGILLFSKEAIMRSMNSMGASEVTSGLIGGFGGGVAQVTIMGPCTFLVTAAVTGDKSISLASRVTSTWQSQGIGGFYRGGTALILRQGMTHTYLMDVCAVMTSFVESQAVTGRPDRDLQTLCETSSRRRT
jgi:hypothetical protein